MSTEQVPVDDPEALHRILANAEALLLDFDGPVCGVFAGFPAYLVANQLRSVLADCGHDELPVEVEKAEDPFEVFRHAAELGQAEASYVEAALRAHEVEAIESASPTAGAIELINSWCLSGRRTVIVSNNSTECVQIYRDSHGFADAIEAIVARDFSDPNLLKPSPYMVTRAIELLGLGAVSCALIGDSESDMQAARAVGVQAIGYANKRGKEARLLAFGANAVVSDLSAIQSCLRQY